MKNVKSAAFIVIFFCIAFLGTQIIRNARTNQVYQNDLAELSHFKYGMFSVDAWKGQITTIISQEIDKLYLTSRNQKTLKKHLEVQLAILIDKITERIKQSNEKSLKGSLKQIFIETFVDINDVKKGIPDYADAMVAELTSSKTEAEIKSVFKARMNKYLASTHDALPMAAKKIIISKYKGKSMQDTKKKLGAKISELQLLISKQALIFICLSTLLFAIELFSKSRLRPIQYIVMTLTLLMLLGVGVTTPMIDMEAKISRMAFILFDHPIEFKDQVLYFQSKSVLDVFWLMITHKEIQMKLVGILMVGFSVIFPILKMLSSLLYYYNPAGLRKNKLVKFFVLKSGKWSMADVMVVAVFMAYIGFSGIINSQLSDIATSVESVEVLTTNGTSLQPGFYIFLTYTLLAMFLSSFLESLFKPAVVIEKDEDQESLPVVAHRPAETELPPKDLH